MSLKSPSLNILGFLFSVSALSSARPNGNIGRLMMATTTSVDESNENDDSNSHMFANAVIGLLVTLIVVGGVVAMLTSTRRSTDNSDASEDELDNENSSHKLISRKRNDSESNSQHVFVYNHSGLTAAQASLMLKKYGRNELKEKKVSLWYVFFSQLWQVFTVHTLLIDFFSPYLPMSSLCH
jgi:magnesium-transporting ATPase (P-type)